jgi:hypothetical protein
VKSFPPPRVIGAFLFTFVCIFGGLTLPWASFGATYSRAFSGAANAFVSIMPSHPRLELTFEGSTQHPSVFALGVDSWKTRLWIRSRAGAGRMAVPLDLRAAHYLPAATFIALTVAFPGADRRRKLVMLGIGLAVLIPLSLMLVMLPLIPSLRGGAFELFSVSDTFNHFVVVFYRAFVAHPGMAYAIPGLLWWLLLSLTRSGMSVREHFREIVFQLWRRTLPKARAAREHRQI